MEEQENSRICAIAKQYEDCIYIEVSSVDSGDKLAYHIGNQIGIITPKLHSGKFQNSILYMRHGENDADNCSIDFRYFPKGQGNMMETYSWSDNIKQAIIKNNKDRVIWFNGDVIEPGVTKVLMPKVV